MEPREILERVDDMLSWLAIGSEAHGEYLVNHFYRAEPMVSLGRGQWAELTPNSVLPTDSPDAPSSPRGELLDWASSALPKWVGSTPRFAHARFLEMDDDLTESAVILQSGYTPTGDDVRDLTIGDDQANPSYIGVRYVLNSIGSEPESSRRAFVTRWRLPQVARVIRVQRHHMFADGRGACQFGFFAMWGEKFFDLQKRPMGLRFKNDDGTVSIASPELDMLVEALGGAYVQDTTWTVELALGAKRTGVGLRTDAIGAREIVNMLRSSDTLQGRKKALVHWVSEHMRRKGRADAEQSIKVAAHLRGVSGLDAGRYHVRIWPAGQDVRAAKNGARFDLERSLP